MNNSRFDTGDIVIFLEFDFIKHDRFNDATSEQHAPLFLPVPGTDEITKMTICGMRCDSEHNVAWSHEPEGEKKYLGYIFTDVNDTSVEWHNQYPKASYGQLDDSADWKIYSSVTGNYRWRHHAGNYLNGIEYACTTISELLAKEIDDDERKRLRDIMDAFRLHKYRVMRQIEQQCGVKIRYEQQRCLCEDGTFNGLVYFHHTIERVVDRQTITELVTESFEEGYRSAFETMAKDPGNAVEDYANTMLAMNSPELSRQRAWSSDTYLKAQVSLAVSTNPSRPESDAGAVLNELETLKDNLLQILEDNEMDMGQELYNQLRALV